MASDGTLFGLIHDLGDRRRARKIRDAQRDYLSDPLAAIQAVNEIDPNVALDLRDDYQNVLAQRNQQEQAALEAERTRALGAARGITQGLMRVQQNGGDVVAAFNEAVPILRNGFNMTDEEIDDWRLRITGDPNTLPNMYRLLNEPTTAESKLYEIGPGEGLYDSQGNNLARQPSLPRTVTVKRADGGTDVLIMDEEGNFVQSGQTGGVPSATASVPGQRLGVNPQARGMRNNNPGNIKVSDDMPWASRQPGFAGSDGTFARFATMEQGIAAQERLLGQNYVNGQRNVTQIVDKYLGFDPNRRGENSRESRDNYIRYVAGQLGLDSSAPVPQSMLAPLAQAMREFENGGGPATGGTGQGPRPAYSTPGAVPEADGWRDLTAAENQQRGLDPNRRYQIGIGGDNEGRIVEVPGQTRPGAGKAGETNGTQEVTSAVSAASRMRDAARRIRNHPSFDQATGSIQGRLPSIFQGSQDFDTDLQAFKDRVVIETITAMKKASETGATGFGQLTEKEGSRLENSMGSLSATSPDNLQRTLSALERDAMISIGTLYNIPPDAVMMLLQNPRLASKFDEKYGRGRAHLIMGDN